MLVTNLPNRQVHLDFHTSEHCLDIGGQFSEKQFAEQLRRGRVQSINFFAYCHHGWCYYPDAVHGLSHPNLKTDLVGGMLKVCREEGVNAEVYITVGWNDKASREHPEWCIRTQDGKILGGPGEGHPHSARPPGWRNLCLNSPYLQQVLDVTAEVLQRYNPGGIWFDITRELPCYCERCQASMRERRLNPESPEDQKQFASMIYKRYLKATTSLIWGINPKATIFHNGSCKKGRHDLFVYDSHLEIESLPSGGWGYDFFPMNARYFTQLQPNKQVVGMTGKFHTAWGEFGGFKHPDALRYECAQIASLGCLASVGDQLHPSGRMDPETYRIIGHAYEYLETREPWLKDARPEADVAIMATMEMLFDDNRDRAIFGATKMLMEKQIPHVIIDETMSISPYRLLILPDLARLDPGFREKLNRFLAQGGSILASYESGLDINDDRFALNLGAECLGRSPWDVEFIEAGPEVSKDLVTSPFLTYRGGMTCRPVQAQVLASTWGPVFNRTYAHFCSHRNSPVGTKTEWPAAIQHGNVIYLSHPIFSIYHEQGMRLHRDFVMNCLERLYPDPLLTCSLPSCGRANVTWQERENRHLLHLLYAAPAKRGNVEVIEDIIPLANVQVTFAVRQPPKAVRLVPEGTMLPFTCSDNRIEFTIPALNMAQIVAVEYS